LQAIDEPEKSRFILEQDGELAELEYDVRDGRLILIHTEVPSPLAGQGIGGRLVEAAAGRARREDLTIEPQCRFARGWLRRHPEVVGTLTVDWKARGN
jgi:uncharacterized protein